MTSRTFSYREGEEEMKGCSANWTTFHRAVPTVISEQDQIKKSVTHFGNNQMLVRRILQ